MHTKLFFHSLNKKTTSQQVLNTSIKGLKCRNIGLFFNINFDKTKCQRNMILK